MEKSSWWTLKCVPSSVLIIVLLLLPLYIGVYGAYWENSLHHDSHHHLDQYHERFDEAAIRNEDERRHHQEEYAEYAARYLLYS